MRWIIWRTDPNDPRPPVQEPDTDEGDGEDDVDEDEDEEACGVIASTQAPEDIASASTNSVIARLHNRLRAELETNRKLRHENTALRQENARLRQRMTRKSALS